MNVLEKILGEIEEATFQEDAPVYLGDMEVDGYVKESVVKEIIRHNMNHNGDDTEMDGWIPVEERLPEEKEFQRAYCRNHYAAEFIVMIENATRPTTLYFKNGSWFDDERNYYKVIAWRPLPKSYKAKKK